MLVLSRKVGEKIQVGPDVTVTVIEVSGGKVRLGIEAPATVGIFRSELNVLLSRLGTEQNVAPPLVANSA